MTKTKKKARSKVCSRGGCRRWRRPGEDFCRGHIASAVSQVTANLSTKTTLESEKKEAAEQPAKKTTTTPATRNKETAKAEDFGEAGSVEDEEDMQRLTAIVDRVARRNKRHRETRSSRALFKLNINEFKQLKPMLTRLVRKAAREGKFSVKNPAVCTPCNVIFAPAGTATMWSNGKIHRDINEKNTVAYKDVYVFMIFLDEVNKTNGAIEVWPGSRNTEVEKKKRVRHIHKEKLESTWVVGPKWSCHYWHSQVLHRSRANQSANSRTTLQFFVGDESTLPKLS